MQWISVKDKLPEMIEIGFNKNPCSENVLVFNGRISVGCRWKTKTEEYFLSNEIDDRGDITHWMPLPNSPKDEKDS